MPRRVLPVIVLAQLAGTSPWFAINAVMPDLQAELGLRGADLGHLTSAVQLGFIVGTLVFALLAIADRFSARRVFLLCACAGGLAATGAALTAHSFGLLWTFRALGGFFLAGIYPIGMKIAAQWFPRGLGAALGLLVAALVVGSASAHALRALLAQGSWTTVFYAVAIISAAAGALLYLGVPEPPRVAGSTAGTHRLSLRPLALIVTDSRLRASVFGYFGHMWELYTMWVLVPLILAARLQGSALSWGSFVVLAVGAIGCAGGGWLASRWGSARVAATQLAISAACCLMAPWAMSTAVGLFALWLLVWGITVSGDSPQLSALTALNAPKELQGTVLTLVNSIGFAISIVSIQLFVTLAQSQTLEALLPWLAIGPALGLLALWPLCRSGARASGALH